MKQIVSREEWLSLAAAPTFGSMALLTGVLGGGMPDILCSATQATSPLNGMTLMYVLMSAFHLTPWLKLVSRNSAHLIERSARKV